MKPLHRCFLSIALGVSVLTSLAPGAAAPASSTLQLNLRSLHKLDSGIDQWQQVTNHVKWEPSRTAAVVCDMWDRHWCKSATTRVAEMAPRMNDVLTELRSRGVLIIHCPSDTM